jgi:hypothetical protein
VVEEVGVRERFWVREQARCRWIVLSLAAFVADPVTKSEAFPVTDPSPSLGGAEPAASFAPAGVVQPSAPGTRRAIVPALPLPGLRETELAQRVLDEGETKPSEARPRTLTPKSPWLALGLSAAVPGAGQFYLNPRSVLPFVYAGIEAVAWVLRISWDHDGDEKTREYERFAWRGDVDPVSGAPLNDILRDEGNWSWERWREGYRTEDDGQCEDASRDFGEFVATDSTLVTFWFTNRHEFYEDIGKYDKYDCGWLNPERREVYRSMRAEANDLLEQSRQMAQVILLNHLASGLHAFFQAKSHNRQVEDQSDSRVPDIRMHFAPDPGGGLHTELVFRRRF